MPVDHNLERELAMLDLGGDVCRCMRIYLDICQHETKHLQISFKPFLDEMMHKRKTRNRGLVEIMHKYGCVNHTLKHLIKLLVRYKCHYESLPDNAVIFVTSAGSRAFARGMWKCSGLLGSNNYLVLHINVLKDWKEKIYDKGMAVIENSLVLDIGDRLPLELLRRDSGIPVNVMQISEDCRFGTRNATVRQEKEGWRFIYMDKDVYFHFDRRIP